MIKLITLLKRKSGTTLEEFSRYWNKKHAPIALETLPGVRKYVQNHAVELTGRGEPYFDGVAEIWFDDLESWRKCADFYLSDEGKVVRDDEDKFLDRSKMVFFIAEEKAIKP